MAIAQLHEWVKGDQNFQKGVELLKEHNPDYPKLFILERFGDIPAHREWLREELQRLASSTEENAKAPSNRSLKPHANRRSPGWFKVDSLSDTLKEEFFNRIKPLYNERHAVHREFNPKKSQDHNADVSRRLKAISDQLDIYFDRAWKFIQTGEEESQGIFARYMSLTRVVQGHREYIARRRKSRKYKQQVSDRQQQLDDDLQELNNLEERLYALT